MDTSLEELIEILQDVKEDVDYETCTTLIDDHVLDSFDILSIISALNDEYDISIPAAEIVPENFNSAEAIWDFIQSLKDPLHEFSEFILAICYFIHFFIQALTRRNSTRILSHWIALIRSMSTNCGI